MKPEFYDSKANRLRYASDAVRCGFRGVVFLVVAAFFSSVFPAVINKPPVTDFGKWFACFLMVACVACIAASVSQLAIALAYHILTLDSHKIITQVRRALYDSEYGNPLHLKDGERLPKVTCSELEDRQFTLQIEAQTATVDQLKGLAPVISSALKGPFAAFAVSHVACDPAGRFVQYRLEDVTIDHSLTYQDVEAMRPERPTLLTVQDNVSIDLTTSGSMLVAGKTRSGKTTGVIALLLQVLLAGRDKFGSLVTIIDPKRAELSQLPHTVTIDDDGEARAIVEALRTFAETVTRRQEVLNGLSDKKGDAVKWYDAGMKPSFLFIDEYVALRSILPKKAAKDDEGYSLDAFDGLLKRIVTMGASAGCFVIVSIAEASVQEGGLPAMLRSAMSTRVLFRPTMTEARLMWDKEKLEAMPDGMVYGPGDAWFSSTDGVHDEVSPVHFPCIKFPAYAELGRLLKDYYTAQKP